MRIEKSEGSKAGVQEKEEEEDRRLCVCVSRLKTGSLHDPDSNHMMFFSKRMLINF